MSGWAKKRFWKDTSFEAVEGGFAVLLDGRAVKTPAKARKSVGNPKPAAIGKVIATS